MRYYVALGAREVVVDVAARPDGGWQASIDGKDVEVDVVPVADSGGPSRLLSLRIGPRVIDLMVESSAAELHFAAVGSRGQARVDSEWARSDTSPGHRRAEGSDTVVSPMPGRVVRVLVAVEDNVERGAPLVVVEAM